jgi:hypothetical protein
VESKMRYVGFVVGFAFSVVWMTVGLGSAIVCALVAALGYGAVYVAERARAKPSATTKPRSRRRMTRRALLPPRPTTAGRSRSARSHTQRPGSTRASAWGGVSKLFVPVITRERVPRPERAGAMDSHVDAGSIAVLSAEQHVLHAGRRATFLHMSRGEAVIRYWGDSHALAVLPETLSLPPRRARRLVAARDEPTTRELTG